MQAYRWTAERVLRELNSAPGGLSRKQAAARLEKHGENRLAQKKGDSLWRRFMLQLSDPMILVLLAAATVRYFRQSRTLRAVREAKPEKAEIILWVLAGVLLLVQLVLAVLMVYGDGDDAYYVAISAAAEESGRMYQKIPYTGMHTELDVRHGLAPFPIWIAWLAQMTGITTVIVAKTLVPVALISMTYGVFYLLGSRVLFAGEGAYRKKWALPAFLLCTEVLVLFGDYSYYTVENFMIARSRQGKAALGSILIPMIFFLLLTLLRKIQEEQKITVGFWVLLGSVMTACCLASTMGALLACMLVGTAGLCGAVSYRKWKLILPLIGCCIPCIVYAGMYLLLG